LGESKDLAKEQPTRAAAMKVELTNYLTSIDAQLPIPNPNYNSATDPVRSGKAEGAEE
jgi:hypothetical protein